MGHLWSGSQPACPPVSSMPLGSGPEVQVPRRGRWQGTAPRPTPARRWGPARLPRSTWCHHIPPSAGHGEGSAGPGMGRALDLCWASGFDLQFRRKLAVHF